MTNNQKLEQKLGEVLGLEMAAQKAVEAKGTECDSKVAKISEDQLKEILEQVRRLRKKRKTEEDNKRQKEEEVSVH